MFAPAQKMRSLSAGDDDRVDLGMLEADALDRVGELDVDAEVVRVQLQLVVGRQAGVLAATSIASVAIGPSKVSFQCS